MSKKVIVSAPATISNVGPGFDIMGFAVDVPSDIIEVELSKTNEIKIIKITGDNGKLPFKPELNTATVSVISLMNQHNLKFGLNLTIHKKMGIGSGLGSSAASSVAAVYAVNKLLDLKLSKHELLEHALAGEIISSGSLHADNVAPCLYGGFVLVRGYEPFEILEIGYPKSIYCSIVYPGIVIKTSDARKILSKTVPLKTAVAQAGNASFLIAGLLTDNLKLISTSTTDLFAEPKRAKLIPCYNEVRSAALMNDALNCNISGSGPAMFAFSESKKKAEKIADEMTKVVRAFELSCKTYVSKINSQGPSVLK
jgi:homoserine kinase